MDRQRGVLITGATGLLGLHWALHAGRDRPVTGVVHRRTKLPKGVRALSVDLTDPAALDSAIATSGARLVVHAAGLTSVEMCEADPDLAWAENTRLAAEVAHASERNGVRLIHISTDHLFDGRCTIYTEDDPVTPLNVYGRTKAEAEIAVLSACPGALVLRTNFYGWGPTYRPSFSDWILARFASGQPAPLFSDVTYSPILIGPLVAAAMELSERGVSGILNATGDETLTKLDFGRRLAAEFGYPEDLVEEARLAEAPGLVRRPASMALSNARLCGLLGRPMGDVATQVGQLRAEATTRPTMEIRAL